jgi:hypothetical protein
MFRSGIGPTGQLIKTFRPKNEGTIDENSWHYKLNTFQPSATAWVVGNCPTNESGDFS